MAWNDFDRFEGLIDKYMPRMGEGETMASQACTAVNKLVYKWFNDGDVYDNVHSNLSGWCNDLSSYANWLVNNVNGKYTDCLYRIMGIYSEDEYEKILFTLAERVIDEGLLRELSEEPKVGTIYNCKGPFVFDENTYEEEDEWEDEEDEEEEDEEEEDEE